jgi:hypothetical protein
MRARKLVRGLRQGLSEEEWTFDAGDEQTIVLQLVHVPPRKSIRLAIVKSGSTSSAPTPQLAILPVNGKNRRAQTEERLACRPTQQDHR